MGLPFARNAWALLGGRIQKMENSEDRDCQDITTSFASNATKSHLEMWTMVNWALWNAQNKYIFEETSVHSCHILSSVSTLMKGFLMVLYVHSHHS